jgi:hypothetical protein
MYKKATVESLVRLATSKYGWFRSSLEGRYAGPSIVLHVMQCCPNFFDARFMS